MRELAVQSASDNLNANDRNSIDLEYQQLKREVNRIANSTNYNKLNLLGGRAGSSNEINNPEGLPNDSNAVSVNHTYQHYRLSQA